MWRVPKSLIVDADPFLEWEGNTDDAEVALRHGSTGVDEQGMRSKVRQEPGRPHRLHPESAGRGAGRPKPWSAVGSAHRWREQNKEHGMVPLGEETSLPGWMKGSRSDP